jgi:hypothetical protein
VHRGVKETEAESVAYVLAALIGLDTSTYSIGYIATWTHGDPEVAKAAAERVLRGVRTLADAILTGSEAPPSDPA